VKQLLTISLFTLVVLTACKKDKGSASPSLKGLWTIENYVTKEYMSGVLTNTYTDQGAGATIDFQNDGNVVVSLPGSTPQTHPYTITADSKVEFDGDIYEIRNLTSSNVTLFIRYDYGAGDYDEESINLKR